MIRKSVEQSPRHSSRKRSQSFGNVCKISRTTMLRVLKQDLGTFLYRIQIYHKLTAADMTRRLDMVNVLIRKVEDCQGFLSDLWTRDEAHCHLDGQVNSHNNIYWGTKAPIQVTQSHFTPQK
ncbi:hypothetical protein LOD99_15111 [Oopsacas minuta]|uniref:Uncharacterized protein n=1 Tax=Oopsacas minuta TaxID=111878 RepID=A0AAV7KCJ2_9METZ|nr:hypothetical protein LOD99_15111 [Oopsacas minuta]